ncbi:hypothetical protein BH11PSE14_BH11PSE14_09270 [soil metagenome]
MDTRIRELLGQIDALEGELRTALHERESRVFFTLRGKRVEFEQSIRQMHQSVRRSIPNWLLTDRPQNFIPLPIIYGMAVPLALFDLCLVLYQALCFPIYRIAKVRRADYIVFDRHHLGYLNIFERLNCEYCAYANGLFAYASEIAARTEQYFCPIKHARKVLGRHARYEHFLDYGDATDYQARAAQLRAACATVPGPVEQAAHVGSARPDGRA